MTLFCRTLCLLLLAHSVAAAERIVSLAPHTTELVYALQSEHKLLAASDFSDYPQAAKALPRVANYQGVDFEALMRLKPDLVLVWQGGNKPQDIQRLQTLGLNLFFSGPQQPEDIASELQALGKLLDKQELAQSLAQNYLNQLAATRARYTDAEPVRVFYYMWAKPMMSVGPNAWASRMLEICNGQSIFADAPSDYPEVTMEGVLARKPQLIVAAFEQPRAQFVSHWQPWLNTLSLQEADLVSVDPDKLHRFSLRLADGIAQLCQTIQRK
ncbi:cobalamin-binding protein [Bowmanella denitrificans]|uniref:cobalamin-binding protein n=1 Tax=Bowmanella denitrificans TaxID=366582 RepID=UPI000C9D1683|nr:cobalamin-binding protein [Bowmanella denitrificans]